jgi:site-specific DNA-methyltransferase (adenine-specific)
MPYNPQGITSAGNKIVTEGYNAGGVVGKRPNQVGKEYEAFTGFPNDVLKFANIWGKRALHSTQKPVDLLEFLIKSYTNENEIVLDNCAGSGTTGVACKNLNRNYILIEKEPEYIEIIKERLK